jgi:predicted CXXCH cytochrome family protein
MMTIRSLLAALALAAGAIALPATAADEECIKCHAPIVSHKVMHGAVAIGCAACHSELDASTTPHRSRGPAPKGLAAEPPALCMSCHESKLFEGKVVHGPVAAGLCTGCHDPHGSDNTAMLVKSGAALCLDCHPDVKKKPHVVVGFAGGGHPLGDVAKTPPVMDPLRPARAFYCAACHEPHRSALPTLLRFPRGMGMCQKCHQK